MVSLITLFTIASVASLTFSNLLAKYAAGYQATNDSTRMFGLHKTGQRYALGLGSILMLATWLLLPVLSKFLQISSAPLVAFSIMLPVSLLTATNKGILQGAHRFRHYTLSVVLEAVAALLFTLGFILLGLSVTGAMVGLICGMAASLIFSQIKIRELLAGAAKSREHSTNVRWIKKLPAYTGTIFLTTLLLAAFANIDVILAKHYLSALDAGNYSALAVLGRIVTYGSFAILTVMFPMASAAVAKNNGGGNRLLGSSLGLVLLISLGVLTVFTINPTLVVAILLGRKYISIAPYLSLFGIAMTLTALGKVFVYYFMATKRHLFAYVFLLITIGQIYFITRYHATIEEIVTVLLVSGVTLFLSMLLLYTFGKILRARRELKIGIAK